MGDIVTEYRKGHLEQEALRAEAVVANFLSDIAGCRDEHYRAESAVNAAGPARRAPFGAAV